MALPAPSSHIQDVANQSYNIFRFIEFESGKMIMHGTSAELANTKQVQAAYVGI